MASEDEVVIDLTEDTAASEPLMFADYHDDVNSHVTGEFTVDKEGADSDDMPTTEPSSDQQMGSIWSLFALSYYQKLFDVTTSQVLLRMLWSMIPTKQSYLKLLKPSADLYGPFWVPMTLLFSIAIAGNLTKLLTQSKDTTWEFHFDEVTFMAGIIFCYTWLIPTILWAILSWQGLAVASMLETIAIYGYSLTIYIPICVLWLLPVPWLQWLLVAVGVVMSGLVMLIALRPTGSTAVRTQFGNLVMLVVILLHAGLGVGFKIYYIHSGFFYDVNDASNDTTSSSSSSSVIVTMSPSQ